MNRHRVLFLTYWYPTLENSSKGIFVKRHAEAAAEIADVELLHVDICKVKKLIHIQFQHQVQENGIKTYILKIGSYFPKLLYILLPLHYLIIKKHIERHLDISNFSHLHSNVIFPCGIIGNRLAKKYQKPHIITEHWTKIDKFFRVSLWRFHGKKSYNNAASVTAVSEMLAETIRRYTTTEIEIIPNVIDNKEFRILDNIEKQSIYTFIGVANWSQYKRPFYFLDALEKLKRNKEIGQFKVLLAGTGDQLLEIKSRNYTYEIEFLGVVSGHNLVHYFNSCHCFVHGSDFETFSVVIAEALQCGLPVVVSPVGIANDVVKESNGYIASTKQEWENALKQVFFRTFNPIEIQHSIEKLYDKKAISESFYYIYNKTSPNAK